MNSDNAKRIVTVEICSDENTPLIDLLKGLLRERASAGSEAEP